jgi:hypothetical protein
VDAAGSFLKDLADGSWVDLGSLIVALLYGKLHCSRRRGRFISKDTGLAILHGIAILPLILLVFASFYDPALRALLHSHKLILAGAGLVALFSMLEHPDVDGGPRAPQNPAT